MASRWGGQEWKEATFSLPQAGISEPRAALVRGARFKHDDSRHVQILVTSPWVPETSVTRGRGRVRMLSDTRGWAVPLHSCSDTVPRSPAVVHSFIHSFRWYISVDFLFILGKIWQLCHYQYLLALEKSLPLIIPKLDGKKSQQLLSRPRNRKTSEFWPQPPCTLGPDGRVGLAEWLSSPQGDPQPNFLTSSSSDICATIGFSPQKTSCIFINNS